MLGQNKIDKKMFGSEIFGQNRVLVEKIFWLIIFLSKGFLVEKNFGRKKILGRKNVWVKKILVQKDSGQKKFCQKKPR